MEWHLPPLNFTLEWLTKGMAPSASKLYPRVAQKKHAPLDWHLPPLNNCPRVARKRHAPLEWHLPPRLSFTFGCLPFDWHFPPLNVTLRWLTKGTRRRNGTFLP